jgi:hypothetical protein
MRLPYFKVLVVGIGIVCLLLFGSAIHLVFEDIPLREKQAASADPRSKTIDRAMVRLEISPALSVSISRPLFRPDRRPFKIPPPELEIAGPPPLILDPPVPPPVPEGLLPPPQFPQILLRGIHKSGQIDAALIESQEHPQGSWKVVNDLVGGWRIMSISSGGVTFLLGKETNVLKLHVDNLANAIGSPPPGP